MEDGFSRNHYLAQGLFQPILQLSHKSRILCIWLCCISQCRLSPQIYSVEKYLTTPSTWSDTTRCTIFYSYGTDAGWVEVIVVCILNPSSVSFINYKHYKHHKLLDIDPVKIVSCSPNGERSLINILIDIYSKSKQLMCVGGGGYIKTIGKLLGKMQHKR